MDKYTIYYIKESENSKKGCLERLKIMQNFY